jgi:hypothetical protein
VAKKNQNGILWAVVAAPLNHGQIQLSVSIEVSGHQFT